MTFYGLILSIYLKIVLFLRIYFAVLQVLKVFFSLFFIQFLSQLKFISQYINLYIKYILYTYECLYVCKKKKIVYLMVESLKEVIRQTLYKKKER